jgi:hypothetical protein
MVGMKHVHHEPVLLTLHASLLLGLRPQHRDRGRRDLPFRAPNTKASGSPRGLCTFRDQDCGLFVIANNQLVAKHHDLDLALQIVGRLGEQSDETAQQEIDESEEDGPNLHEKKGRSYEPCPRQRSTDCVPFRVSGSIEPPRSENSMLASCTTPGQDANRRFGILTVLELPSPEKVRSAGDQGCALRVRLLV